MAPLDVGHPHPPEGREESILRLINRLACVSGVSAVLLVSPAIVVAAYHAPYEQRLSDLSSGGKSVLVAGSIQSPSAVLQSCRRSNDCPRVPQPSN
jgi:hypothetical protein